MIQAFRIFWNLHICYTKLNKAQEDFMTQRRRHKGKEIQYSKLSNWAKFTVLVKHKRGLIRWSSQSRWCLNQTLKDEFSPGISHLSLCWSVSMWNLCQLCLLKSLTYKILPPSWRFFWSFPLGFISPVSWFSWDYPLISLFVLYLFVYCLVLSTKLHSYPSVAPPLHLVCSNHSLNIMLK